LAKGNDLDRIITLNDLVSSDDVFFAASGITNGEFLGGVRYRGGSADTHSIMMRSVSGTLRGISTTHNIALKKNLAAGAAYVPD